MVNKNYFEIPLSSNITALLRTKIVWERQFFFFVFLNLKFIDLTITQQKPFLASGLEAITCVEHQYSKEVQVTFQRSILHRLSGEFHSLQMQPWTELFFPFSDLNDFRVFFFLHKKYLLIPKVTIYPLVLFFWQRYLRRRSQEPAFFWLRNRNVINRSGRS